MGVPIASRLTESAGDTAVVLISHDCDIVQTSDVEPMVEVIIGREIEKTNGNYLNAKSARTLHLPYTAGSDNSVTIELSALLKRQIDKSTLFTQSPTATAKSSPEERRTLQRWLAIRYFRASFPNEFVRRLKNYGIEERINRIAANAQAHLTAIYVDLDEDKEIERNGESDIYTLSIYLVYPVDTAAAGAAAAVAKSQIDALFDARCKKDGRWVGIQLEGCYVNSTAEITLLVAGKLKKWNTDHMSLRAEPQGPMTTI